MMPATEVIIGDFNFLFDLIKNQTRVVVNMTSDGAFLAKKFRNPIADLHFRVQSLGRNVSTRRNSIQRRIITLDAIRNGLCSI